MFQFSLDILQIMIHYLTANFILLSTFIARGSSFTCAELEGWVDGESVDLRCLYFHKQSTMNYSEAKEYCNNHYAQLVEFENEEQMNFVKNAIPADGFWWCGANDEKREGDWFWEVSGKPVEKWAWGTAGEPYSNIHQNFFVLIKDSTAFYGKPFTDGNTAYPVCQILATEIWQWQNLQQNLQQNVTITVTTTTATTTTTLTATATVPVTLIAGASAAGVVLIVIVIILIVWRRGVCLKIRSVEVIEENELYGHNHQSGEYYQYQYGQTSITDSNYMYNDDDDEYDD